MKCFYHNDRDSVGLCRACSKGLCPECAADLGTALACKERHEDMARKLSGAQVRAGQASSILPFFACSMGLLFIVWGVVSQPLSLFMTLLGVAFFVVGIASIKRRP